MEKSCICSSMKFLIIMIYLLCLCGEAIGDKKPFSAMFVFGDSLIDNGNNNYLLTARARANYAPYGIDYVLASGRFTNGKNLVDYFAEIFGLPRSPPFASALATGPAILTGVNFASAGGGILDITGQNLGNRFSLRRQIEYFRITKRKLGFALRGEDLDKHIGNALAVIIIGSNDYINNYLHPSYPTRLKFDPTQYATLLADEFHKYIMELYNEGIRKFYIGGAAPLGCTPGLRTIANMRPGTCVKDTNDIIYLFNRKLDNLLDHLSFNISDAVFFYSNLFSSQMEILSNPHKYGLKEISEACCGMGKNKAQVVCPRGSIPCEDRDTYAWWDAYHPSQAVHKALATLAYNGTHPFIRPFNFRQIIHPLF